MYCPYCQSPQIVVANSRPTRKNLQVWRRRKCLSCKKVFSTYESIDLSYMKVIKKTGKKERFIRSKLLVSIYQAIVDGKGVDRGDAAEKAEVICRKIERKIVLRSKNYIETKEIGRLSLETMKAKYPDAFLRYVAYFNSKDLGLLRSIIRVK